MINKINVDGVDHDIISEPAEKKIAENKEKLDTLVVNDLTTGGADKALSAEMGKVLSAELTELESEVSELDFVVNGAEIEAFVDVTDEITTTENEIGKLLPRYYIQGFDGFLGYTNGGNAYVYKTQEGDVWKAENLSVGGNKSRCWGVYSDDSIAEGNRALNNIVQMDSDNTGNRANVSSGEITIQSGCKYIAFCVWGTDKPIIYKKKKISGESLLGKINKLNNTILSLDEDVNEVKNKLDNTILSLDGYVNEFDVMIKDFKA